jgi:membrane fusion protein (multidrug efflux system)
MKPHVPLARIATLTAALMLAGCNKDAGQAAAPAAVPVSVLQVQPREVPVAYEAVARTEGSREVQIRARVAGILEQQLYGEGDAVKAGAPLFRIERAPFEIDLAQQRAALGQEQSRLELAKQEFERLKGLADKRAISQREADQAASTLKQSEAAVQLAQARVRQSELNLSYTTVEAPIAGVTGRAQQSIGSLLAPNADSSLLTTLTRTDPIWVRFALAEAEYASLRQRDPKQLEVKLILADGSGYAAPGRLNFAGSTVDANLGTVQMRAEFPNPKLQLLPGQYVKVQVVAGTQQAIVVPQSAVLENQSGRFVWLIGPEGKALARNVKTGSWLGQDWVVLGGLQAGDSVIVNNLVRLRPGTPVEVKPLDVKPDAKPGAEPEAKKAG